MRSFICSALLIIGVLVGQQWMVKAASAHEGYRKYENVSIERGVIKDNGFAAWARGAEPCTQPQLCQPRNRH